MFSVVSTPENGKFVTGGKSMKHAAFNEAWVKQQ
jgi:hypothetical protein